MAAAPREPTPGVQWITFPTPVLNDRVFYEDHDHRLARFGPRQRYTKTTLPAYGTAHLNTTDFEGFRLAGIIKLDGKEGWYRWVYANDLTDQDTWNEECDLAGDIDIWRRTYLFRRTEWTAQAEGTADPVVATRKLIREQKLKLDDPALSGLFVVVIRTYANFDTTADATTQIIAGGDVVVLEEVEEEFRIISYKYYQIVDKDLVLPIPGNTVLGQLGSLYRTGKLLQWSASAWSSSENYVYSARKLRFEQSKKYRLIEVWYGPVPPTRFEYPSVGETFPGKFYDLEPWLEAGDADGFSTPAPWAGIHFKLIPPRSKTVMGREKISYFIGEGVVTAPPETFRVISPAAASRFWRDIPHKTVHPSLTVIEISSSAGSATVETFAASTPATYDYTDILTVQAWDQTWRGCKIKERHVIQISESRNPYTFPN